MKKTTILILTCFASYFAQAQPWKVHVPDRKASMNDMSCPDGTTCYAVGWKGGIFKTTDSGGNWFKLNSETDVNLTAIACPDDRTCFALGNDGKVYKSLTSGQSWESQNLPQSGTAIHFATRDIGFISGVGLGVLLKTTNNGLTWEELETNYTGVIKQVQFIDATKGFALGQEYNDKTKESKATILKTTDGGSTWSVLYNSTTKVMTDFQFLGSQFGFVTMDKGMLLKTTDGGLTWQESLTGSPKLLTTVHFVDNATGYVAGALGTLYKTTNRGATWTAIDIQKKYQFLEIFFTPAQKGIAVVAGNTIITQY